MPLISKIAAVVAAIAGLGLIASVPIVANYEAKGVLTQRVRVDKSAKELFGNGSSNTPVGSPQKIVIEDEAAILQEKGENGVRLADEDYLVQHKIYPLQLSTVNFVASLVRIALVVLLGLAGLAYSVSKKLNPQKLPS